MHNIESLYASDATDEPCAGTEKLFSSNTVKIDYLNVLSDENMTETSKQ